MTKFIPRTITPEQASRGYNNEGCGRLLGYISDPKQHEASCPYRKNPAKSCGCRIGLWREGLKPKPVPKKQSSARLSKIAGRYLDITIEELFAMEPANVVRDVRALAGSVESQFETPKPKKKVKR